MKTLFNILLVIAFVTLLAGCCSSDWKHEGEVWTTLFNGQNLNGWTGDTDNYHVENGVLICKGSNLFTEKEFADFHLKFEFKLPPAGNNGLAIRAPLQGNAAYLGMEIQILDNTAPKYADLKPYQYHGSIYGIAPAQRGFLKPLGQWNKEEVIAQGNNIKVILNGKTILETDITKAVENGTPDGKDHPGLKQTKGHLGFLGHGAEVKFRNIKIKELTRK